MKQAALFLCSISFLFFQCTNNTRENEAGNEDLNHKNETASTENTPKVKEQLFDSLNNLFVGDCFTYKASDLKKGFVLIKIVNGVYDFASISLDSTKRNMDAFRFGTMRMVPYASVSGSSHEWGSECIGAMGQDGLIEFLQSFSKTGKLEFNDLRPGVVSSSYLVDYSPKEMKEYFREQEMMWPDQRKYLKVTELIKN